MKMDVKFLGIIIFGLVSGSILWFSFVYLIERLTKIAECQAGWLDITKFFFGKFTKRFIGITGIKCINDYLFYLDKKLKKFFFVGLDSDGSICEIGDWNKAPVHVLNFIKTEFVPEVCLDKLLGEKLVEVVKNGLLVS